MELCIKNARVHGGDGCFYERPLYIRGDRIVPPFPLTPDAQVLDGKGALVCPGLFDLHTHGRLGADFCSASPRELAEMAADYARHGVTALLPTLATDSPAHWGEALKRLEDCHIPAFLGVHLEGRWLSPARRGAHALSLLAPPNGAELKALASGSNFPIKKVTFAPEADAGDLLAACLEIGAHASIGHSDADYATAVQAVSAGADSFTHLYNAMSPLHHRAGGAVAAALLTHAYTELIADGIHVAPETVRLTLSIKGTDKLILISDSMAGTGCADGIYTIAGQTAILENGIAKTPDGALAGSTLNLLQGVQNLARFGQIPFGKALLAATRTPAMSLGLGSSFGTLEEGAFANLFLLERETDPVPQKVLSFGEWVK